MRSITRNYHGYDSIADEHLTDTQPAIIIGKRVIAYRTELGITFEQFEYIIADTEESIDIHEGDKSHRAIDIPFPQHLRLNIRELANMTLVDYGKLLFKEATE